LECADILVVFQLKVILTFCRRIGSDRLHHCRRIQTFYIWHLRPNAPHISVYFSKGSGSVYGPSIVPVYVGESGLSSTTIVRPPPKRHLDRLSRFCRNHGRIQHTGASPGQNMWGGQTWRAPYNGVSGGGPTPYPSPCKNRRICINFRSDL